MAEDESPWQICAEGGESKVFEDAEKDDSQDAAEDLEVASSCGPVELDEVFKSDGVLEDLEDLERKSPFTLKPWLLPLI